MEQRNVRQIRKSPTRLLFLSYYSHDLKVKNCASLYLFTEPELIVFNSLKFPVNSVKCKE